MASIHHYKPSQVAYFGQQRTREKLIHLTPSEGRINSRTYKSAGVDIDRGTAFVEAIKPLAQATVRPGAGPELGGFGARFDLAAAGFRDPVLVAATDGVGTKLSIAIALGQHQRVGVDLVAMCVNDLVVEGAEPLFFLDYFATAALDQAVAVDIVRGIAEGCRQAGCALIGGETAEMPGMYATGDYDLAGFAVGAAERDALVTGSDVVAGDVVLGLASDGLHANGFSLVRRIVGDLALDYAEPAPFDASYALGDALLMPTRIYVRPCLAALRAGQVKALAHITGGGLVGNLPRVLPDGTAATLSAETWPMPPVFAWLINAGGVAAEEMVRTFNCGIGMAAVVAPDMVDDARETFGNAGEQVYEIGRIVERGADSPALTITGLEQWQAG